MNADALMFRQETTRQGRLRVVTCRIDVELIPRYERIGWRVLIDSRTCAPSNDGWQEGERGSR